MQKNTLLCLHDLGKGGFWEKPAKSSQCMHYIQQIVCFNKFCVPIVNPTSLGRQVKLQGNTNALNALDLFLILIYKGKHENCSLQVFQSSFMRSSVDITAVSHHG